MTTIRVEKKFAYGGKKYGRGDLVDLPEKVAKEVMNKGFGTEPLTTGPEEGDLDLGGEDEGREAGEGVNVEGMMPGGTFIQADDVAEGDSVRVQGPGYVDDSFDSDRLVLPVEFEDEDKRVSLGPQNIERIAAEYGMNTKSWVDRVLLVDSLKKYEGIEKKGIVWKPVKVGGTEEK